MDRRRIVGILLVALGASAFPSTAYGHIHDSLPKLSRPAERSTPRAAMSLFLDASRNGEYARAAYALDLRVVPAPERAERGPELARKLHSVIGRKLWIDLEELPGKDKEEELENRDEVVVEELALGSEQVALTLEPMWIGDERAWLISTETINHIDALYEEYGPVWIEEQLPPKFSEITFLDLALWQWLGIVASLLLAMVLAFVLAFVVIRVGWRIAERTHAQWDDLLIGSIRGPARAFLTVVLFWALVLSLKLPLTAQAIVDRILQIALTGSVAWFLLRLVDLVATSIEKQAIETAESDGDDLKVRGVRTQVRVLRRVVTIGVAILAVAIVLLQFESVRSVGMSLLASAGVLGIIFGLAAQRSIGTMLAGIQVSVTQPVRIGDTVIVEGHWGHIEEITLTYAVVRIWDDRRLIVPVTRFLDETFENWTKVSTELFGTVYLYTDYRLPIDDVRAEVQRILDGHPNFDGRAWSVLVTDAREQTMEVRILVSAKDALQAWKVRCDVREKLIRWLQSYEGGRFLPRARVELDRDEGTAVRAAE